jgi:hypothetical protein
MTYSDSTHFSDKISYKILLISSYQSKDMDLTNLHICRNFRKKNRERIKTARAESDPDLRRRILSVARGRRLRTKLLGRGPFGAPDLRKL